MAASTAQYAYGTTLGWDKAGSTSYSDIVNIRKITVPGSKRAMIDTTHMTSVLADAEFLPGIRDCGEVRVEFDFNMADTQHYDLYRWPLSDAGGTYPPTNCPKWNVIYVKASGAPTATFSGWPQDFDIDAEFNNKMLGTFVIKITGSITWAQ